MVVERVYSYLDDKYLNSRRPEPGRLLVAKGKIVDSDQAILTDRRGYRYKRDLSQDLDKYYSFRRI